MEASRPRGLWLRAYGCFNGPVWVAVDLIPGRAMFLTRGWKSFARSQGIGLGDHLHFHLDGSTILFIKFVGARGIRLACCAKTLCGNGIDTSGDINDNISVFSLK
ncbi:l-ascorbate oxidase-like protein [Hordeum vulgare]|nr:l-ascorbate oxidase-like protein [Hordeum vulgare]